MATPTATATEIKNGALTKLNVIAAGETASSADATLAGDTLDRLLDDMEERRDIDFTKNNVPDTAKFGLIDMLAAELAVDFGLPSDQVDRLRLLASASRKAFQRRTSASSPGGAAFSNF